MSHEDGPSLRVAIAILTTGAPERVARIAACLPDPSRAPHDQRIIAVDNAPGQGRETTFQHALQNSPAKLCYVAEPRRGIPFARNAAIRAAKEAGDLDALIFLDDDEWPAPGWLDALLATWRRSGADIVMGPVRGVLPDGAPAWARRSGIFDKDRHLPGGARIRTAYSCNTLLSHRVLSTLGPTFDTAFRHIGSSDHDYFKRATQAGLRSVWSPNALVYEQIGWERLRLGWALKRGYRIGVGARLSAQRRLNPSRAVARTALLVVANVGYGVLNVVGTWHPRLSWVEGLRRGGIASGLAVGNLLGYEEYRPDTEPSTTDRPSDAP